MAESPVSIRFSLRSLFIATMALCVLLALLWPAIQAARRGTQRRQCKNNLRQIALGLHNYWDIHKALPYPIIYAADGTPMHSWRVALAPYLTQNAFYDDYDYGQAWNGPGNLRLTDDIPEVPASSGAMYAGVVFDADYFAFRCPSAPASQHRMCTNYVMLIDDRPGKPNGLPNLPGSVAPRLDAKSAVIVIEIVDSDIYWMEPRDVLLSDLSMKLNDRSKLSPSSHHGGACVLYSDGTVEVLDDRATEASIRKLLAQ